MATISRSACGEKTKTQVENEQGCNLIQCSMQMLFVIKNTAGKENTYTLAFV